MRSWPSGKTLTLYVPSREFGAELVLNNYSLCFARCPNVLQVRYFRDRIRGFRGASSWHCRHKGLVEQRMWCSNPSLIQFQVLGTPRKILTRCPVRWSRWTSTQFRLGYAVRSLLGFGPRVARVLNYASCTLVRDTEGYLAAPSLRDYLIFR